MTTNTNTDIRPFHIEIPQADLDDLRDRLARTRYAPAAPGDSWDYGTPESYLRVMVERWQAFTGETARLESDGRTFAAITAERRPQDK